MLPSKGPKYALLKKKNPVQCLFQMSLLPFPCPPFSLLLCELDVLVPIYLTEGIKQNVNVGEAILLEYNILNYSNYREYIGIG